MRMLKKNRSLHVKEFQALKFAEFVTEGIEHSFYDGFLSESRIPIRFSKLVRYSAFILLWFWLWIRFFWTDSRNRIRSENPDFKPVKQVEIKQDPDPGCFSRVGSGSGFSSKVGSGSGFFLEGCIRLKSTRIRNPGSVLYYTRHSYS